MTGIRNEVHKTGWNDEIWKSGAWRVCIGVIDYGIVIAREALLLQLRCFLAKGTNKEL